MNGKRHIMATTYAFGRSLTAAAAGADLRFTFERDDAASGLAVPVNVVPYQLQGNPELHSSENTKKRMALKNDKRVQTQLERFWRVFGVGDNGTISEDEYLAVHVKMATVLIPDITPEEARAAGESDWLDDVQGAERMSKVAFMACLFEVADLYTTGIDGGAYATWLDRLFKRITVRLSTGPDGKIVATLPPKPSSARLREYRTFRLSLITAGRVTAAEGPPPPDKPPTDAFAELERLRLAAPPGGGGGDGGIVDEAEEDGAGGAGEREDEDEEEEDDIEDEDGVVGSEGVEGVERVKGGDCDDCGEAGVGAMVGAIGGASESLSEASESSFAWAADEDVFPHILYTHEEIKWSEDGPKDEAEEDEAEEDEEKEEGSSREEVGSVSAGGDGGGSWGCCATVEWLLAPAVRLQRQPQRQSEWPLWRDHGRLWRADRRRRPLDGRWCPDGRLRRWEWNRSSK